MSRRCYSHSWEDRRFLLLFFASKNVWIILDNVVGVKTVNANLETKRVDVECEEAVEENVLMNALKKWAGSSGKVVETWV